MAFAPDESVVILGTSRGDGNTRTTVEAIVAGKPIEVVDLSRLELTGYDYRHRNERDEFVPLMESIASKALWILATPVYWYTMSAQLKLFIDRLSDLTTIRKDLGRHLRGKSVALVVSGTDSELPPGFETPFCLTCQYLGILYLGAFYWRFEKSDRAFPHLEARANEAGAKWIS
jgi:multimeric flavodoxin WrbA